MPIPEPPARLRDRLLKHRWVCVAIGSALGGAVGYLLVCAGHPIRLGAAFVIGLSCWAFLDRERRRIRRWRTNLRRSGKAHLN